MRLKVIQGLEKGFLGGPKQSNFTFFYNNAHYEIMIEQLGERIITISSFDTHTCEDTLRVYYTLETLLMLFDGQFYPIVSATKNDTQITDSWKQLQLPSHNSADFCLGSGNILLDFQPILNERLFYEWIALSEELDINFKMVLYCLSDVKMPVDMKCAFMVEAFLGICELISKKDTDFSLPYVTKDQSKLKCFFSAVADKYGEIIFEAERCCNMMDFVQVLVNSRNRIAHIKSRQTRVYMGGAESVVYLMKLSLLYRVVLFDLLGISKMVYEERLRARVRTINTFDSVQKFLGKLGDKNGGPA